MLKKICPICNKTYYTNANASKYCSEKCSSTVRKSKKASARHCICKVCGNEFTTKHRKSYCSEKCRMYANGRGSIIPAKKEPPKPRYTLSQVAAMANAEGMTYGNYVQKYQL